MKRSNKSIFFPYYSGNILLAKSLGHVSLHYFINAHKNPTARTREILTNIRLAELQDNKALKRQLKQQLYSFTPSVYIPRGQRRKYENISHWTGLMQLDFDKLRDKQEALDLKEDLFNRYRHIVTAYTSPSMKGVKALMRIVIPKNKDHYKALHKAVVAEMEQYDCFDEATTNAMLPLFLSHDEAILYRDYSECYEWTDADYSKTDYAQLNNEPTNFNPEKASFNEGDYRKTVRIFENKLRSICSDGHPQLRSACLILGSRVRAGYITEGEARLSAQSLIRGNSYLQKDINNYIRTANWAISEGMKNPKYY